MNADKYNHKISLQCPTCGSTQFEHSDESEVVKCASCTRETTKSELIHENSENIHMHTEEIKQQVVQDIDKQLKSSLQDAFKGNKFIKVK